MKTVFASVVFSFVATIAIAQTGNEKIVGKNFLTGSDIIAKDHVFDKRIHDFYIDTTTNCITLQLRGMSKNGKWLSNIGSIVLYDLVNNREKWTKIINYQMQDVNQFDNTIVFTKKQGHCIDADTGKDKWKVRNTIYYVDPDYNIGIGYNLTRKNMLQGVDLSNGKILWNREIDRDYGWNSLKFLDDSTALITAAGLHTVNLRTGAGWDYNSITGDKDYTSTAAANAAGVVLGVLTGTFVMTTGYDLVRDLVSNTIITDEDIYLADTKRISRFDYNGNRKWSVEFEKDKVSKSNIFLRGDTLYMVNLGYAFMGNRKLSYGIPFIAAYDKNSGDNIFMTEIGGKKTPINNWIEKNNTILLLFNDKIVKYSLVDGNVLVDKPFEDSPYGQLTDFLSRFSYVKKETGYEPVRLSNPDNTYVLNSEKAFVLNDNFDVIGEIDFDQMYFSYLRTDRFRFLGKGEQTTVIDEDDNEVATFEAGHRAFLVNDQLYEVKDNIITQIDLSTFFNIPDNGL